MEILYLIYMFSLIVCILYVGSVVLDIKAGACNRISKEDQQMMVAFFIFLSVLPVVNAVVAAIIIIYLLKWCIAK